MASKSLLSTLCSFRFCLLGFLLAITLDFVASDVFSEVDSNHDGSLSKLEFRLVSDGLHSFKLLRFVV